MRRVFIEPEILEFKRKRQFTFSGISSINLSVGDSVSLLDTQTGYQPDAGFPSIFTNDLIVLSDSAQATFQQISFLTTTASDSLIITDATSGAFAGLFIVVGDTLTFLDNFNYLYVTAADSFTISDQLMSIIQTLDITLGDFPSLSISDGFQIELVDSATSTNIYVPILADSITFTDSTNLTLNIPLILSDSLSITDGLILAGSESVVISDSFTITDNVGGIESPLGVTVSDFLTLSDFQSLLLSGTFTSPIADQFIFTDAFFFNATMESPTQSDEIDLSDEMQAVLELNLEISDTMSFSDSDLNDNVNSPSVNKMFADTISMLDFVITESGGNINLSDPLALSDGLGLSDNVAFSVTENINSYLRRYLNDVISN